MIDSLIEPEFVGGQEIAAMRIALKQSRSYSAIGGQAQQRKRCQDEDQPHVSQFSDCSIQHKSKLPRALSSQLPSLQTSSAPVFIGFSNQNYLRGESTIVDHFDTTKLPIYPGGSLSNSSSR